MWTFVVAFGCVVLFWCCCFCVVCVLSCLCLIAVLGWYFWFPGLPPRSSTLAKTEVVLPPLFTTLCFSDHQYRSDQSWRGDKNCVSVFVFLVGAVLCGNSCVLEF